MARRTYSAVVAGTALGGRSDLIKAFARQGAEVQLRREAASKHPEAIGVWLRCPRFWGLWKTWAHIGFIEHDGEQHWAHKMDTGRLRVVKAWVHSAHAPLEHRRPRVLLRVTFEGDDTREEMVSRPMA